jgi:hypothetical protein
MVQSAGLVNSLGVVISIIIIKSKAYETEVENDMALMMDNKR